MATDRLKLLKQLSFGSQVAEDEVAQLQEYFVQTDQWNRIIGGEIDLVRGEKGAGKSALYLLLEKNKNELFDRNILTVSGENPRGTTVFRDLIADPPAREAEFVVLWKLYILTIVCHELRDFGINKGDVGDVYGSLEDARLLERELNLPGLLRMAQSFARRLVASPKLEGGVELDPTTGLPTGVIGRISLQEPSSELRSRGISSIDGMFQRVNTALESSGYTIWVLLDRLDVAFAESHELEANAIRALIRVYGDMRANQNISLKIFLREDIWKRVTSSGLREASHITRYEVMRWTSPMLLNLLVRRIVSNEILCREMGFAKEKVLADAERQRDLFARIFPAQVEQGTRKATTFDWMVGRCADGTGATAPRELIHLLNCIRTEEIRRLERGEGETPGEQLFDRSVFKLALPIVSDTRLNTYLYAEYPAERAFVQKLKGEKAEQTPESLAAIWGLSKEAAVSKAQELVALGFFQSRGQRSDPTFWVPFLYRDALELVQGRAGGADDEALAETEE
ncbi:P-loop ATPase, Sll1717 family [Labrys okinawensis]|uniref:P-loop ATPase, Sll1717 family n=1 Tax=Labrys okinawensis TaxID=346911 RepID=UPI0039BD88C8